MQDCSICEAINRLFVNAAVLMAIHVLLLQGAKLIDLESVAEVGEGGVASLVGVGKSMPYAAPEVVVEPRKPAMSSAAAGSSGSWGHQEQPSQGDVPDPLAGMQLNDASRTYAADIWSLGVVLFELFTDASCSTPNRAVVRARWSSHAPVLLRLNATLNAHWPPCMFHVNHETHSKVSRSLLDLCVKNNSCTQSCFKCMLQASLEPA